MTTKWITSVLAVALSLAINTYSLAAILEVDATGQLLGASEVDVGGTLYDVAFEEGSCIGLFGGCDEIGDFLFQNLGSASTASQALLDQVFLDGLLGDFDTIPSLTNGVGLTSAAIVLTPYQLSINSGFVDLAYAYNHITEALDRVDSGQTNSNLHTDQLTSHVYAVWAPAAPVPEPATMLLFGTSLVGLVGSRLRKKKK